MSSRTRTRAATTPKPPPSKQSKKQKRLQDSENTKPQATPKSSKSAKSPTPPVYCTCRKGDDGSPMVNCGECDEWYHFSCVSLSEQIAEDINVYICSSCADKTGQRTVMLWEGPEAVEDASKTPTPSLKATPKPVPTEPEPEPEHDSAEEPDSEDEYVADRLKRRRARRLSFSSESGSESSAAENNGRSKRTASPGASKGAGHLKRKAAHKAKPPPSKRKKEASASDARDDPARAFCLGKLEIVFRDIFFRYPHVQEENEDGESSLVEKKPDELVEAEKAKVEKDSTQFASDLERCVYDTYSEPDKQGRPSAGGKYKDRFRMLQFNLSKPDRTVLHKRIASGEITPKDLSLMSSTDLANEQMKESMKMAEKEALEHSILEKTVIPRAKLTHKGLEDIEDLDNDPSNSREREVERQRVAEVAKRERERAARARTRTASVSVPPESPITPVSASWGGPPPAVTSSMEPTGTSFTAELSAEPEMNLADLINIDDELPAQDAAPVPPSPTLPDAANASSSPPPSSSSVLATSSPTTGISPFAIKPDLPARGSFDLSSLWAEPKEEPVASPPPAVRSPTAAEDNQDRKEEPMDLDETDDQDFDMFLEEKDPTVLTSEALQAAFEALPQVWSGKINMPLDSTIPQETPVVARQVGGRTLEPESLLWKTLFPSDLLRIDGRVPVDKSAQFLLQTRMNSTRELIAVAFSSASSGDNIGFQILMDFLIAKGRHGLVFPWGPRPKDFHPGKELYIIPLLSSDSLPDYMELLDNLHLPKVRNSNILVGIWVLNKGKLAPPPPPPAIAPTPAVVPQFTAPPVPAIPGIPTPAVAPLTFEPSVLAAEVAALTPEQVRMMLQSLTATTLNALPVPAPIPPPLQPPPPIAQPPQQWGAPPPGPSMGYPPPPPPIGHHQQHGPPYAQRPPYDQPPYDRRDYNNREPGPGYDRGRGNGRDNGWNSRGRGRGRGRGGGGGAPPIDSGWSRRRDGPSSPDRRRWN